MDHCVGACEIHMLRVTEGLYHADQFLSVSSVKRSGRICSSDFPSILSQMTR